MGTDRPARASKGIRPALKLTMIATLFAAYAVVTLLFIAGLALAARRPMPRVDNSAQLPGSIPQTQREPETLILSRAA